MELIMFVGIPASGKSTQSTFYRERGYLVLSSDQIRESITEGTWLNGLTEKEQKSVHNRVFELIRRQTAEALKRGQSVVVDATNLGRKRRMAFLEQFRRFPCVKKCLLFITPVDLCMERNGKRSGNACVPEAGMQKMLCNFECPNYWEGWDEIIPVAYATPYRFPFDEIKGYAQDNPHHTLTLDGHLDAAVRYCREQGYGDMLEKVAGYHDIGKLYTKRYCNVRGEPTKDAHYLGHDNYGAYLYLTEMCCGRELSREEFEKILYEANLIICHMRPLALWRGENSTEEKDRKLFGEKFIADLLALNSADRAAH